MAIRTAAAIALLAVADLASACATCGGPADAPQTHGMNAAILTLFGVLTAVVLTVAFFVAVIARRIARHDTASVEVETSLPSALPEY